MINAKAAVLFGSNSSDLSAKLNDFLGKIDARQIIKTEHSTTEHSTTNIGTNSVYLTAIVYYVDFEDIRDAKLDTIFKQ